MNNGYQSRSPLIVILLNELKLMYEIITCVPYLLIAYIIVGNNCSITIGIFKKKRTSESLMQVMNQKCQVL